MVIETTGVWCHDDMTSWHYNVMSFCDTHWSNLRFIGLFFQNAVVEYIGVYTDTNNRRKKKSINGPWYSSRTWNCMYYCLHVQLHVTLHATGAFTQWLVSLVFK